MDKKHKCPRCGYEWDARVEHPKKCPNPNCQAWLIKLPEPKEIKP